MHGGVCTYIKNSIRFTVLGDLSDPDFEAPWLKVRPNRLPRGFSDIIVGLIYHPPSSNNSLISNYLMTSLSAVESTYPGVAIILLGDFNKLNVSNLKSSFKLKQIVPFPTQGPSSLDLIITNLQNYYDVPERRPAFGLSDHISVEVMPKLRSMLPISRYKIKSRDLRPSNRKATGLYLKNVDISPLISNAPSCSEKAAILETVIKTDLDTIVPFTSKTIYANEPPRINPRLKNLIKQRQKALAHGNLPLFRLLRNRVNRERKCCRGKYYETKVAQLKDCKPSMWWKEVKKLCGLSPASQNPDDYTKSLQQIEGVFNKDELLIKLMRLFYSQ